MRTGDRIILKNHPHKPKGTIVKVRRFFGPDGKDDEVYLVQFDDASLYPPQLEYQAKALEFIEHDGKEEAPTYQEPIYQGRDCVCGSDAISEDVSWIKDSHAPYCPKYRKP